MKFVIRGFALGLVALALSACSTAPQRSDRPAPPDRPVSSERAGPFERPGSASRAAGGENAPAQLPGETAAAGGQRAPAGATEPAAGAGRSAASGARPDAPGPTTARGGYYMDDGPGSEPAPDPKSVPEPQPRREPLHARANRPYVVFGKSYQPMTDIRQFRQRGHASWYGRKFHGQRTSSGEVYDMYAMTAAHPTLPIPSYARVTNVRNGEQVIVRVNDRGPFLHGRVIDLSYTAASKLGYVQAGSTEVEVELLTLPAEDSAPATLASAAPPAQRSAESAARNRPAAVVEERLQVETVSRTEPPAPAATRTAGASAEPATADLPGGPAAQAATAATATATAATTTTATTGSATASASSGAAGAASSNGGTSMAAMTTTTTVGSTTAVASSTTLPPSTAAGASATFAASPANAASTTAAAPTPATASATTASSRMASAPAASPTAAVAAPTAVTAAPSAASASYVQFGAFNSRENAESIRQQIGRQFAWLRQPLQIVRDGSLFKLQAGPFGSRDDAHATAERVRGATGSKPFVLFR